MILYYPFCIYFPDIVSSRSAGFSVPPIFLSYIVFSGSAGFSVPRISFLILYSPVLQVFLYPVFPF